MTHLISNFGLLNVALVSFMMVFLFTLAIAMLKEKDKAASQNPNDFRIFQREYRPGKFYRLITVFFGVISILLFLSIKNPSSLKSILMLSVVAILGLGSLIFIINHLIDVLIKNKPILMGGIYFDNPSRFVKYVLALMYVFIVSIIVAVLSIIIPAIYKMVVSVIFKA